MIVTVGMFTYRPRWMFAKYGLSRHITAPFRSRSVVHQPDHDMLGLTTVFDSIRGKELQTGGEPAGRARRSGKEVTAEWAR